ncbi:MAG: hypothetical protein R3B48_20285 [Kofleriaceae bacterium]
MRWSLSTALCALVACSGAGRPGAGSFGVPPGASTQAVLVSALCERGEPCACRDERARVPDAEEDEDGDAPEGAARRAARDFPPAEAKRLEIRLRSTHELWLRIGEWTFYKDRERAEACYYIDVPAPGVGERAKVHEVELRGSNDDGVSVGLALNELGVAARTWYQTFRFACGVPGVCTFDELDGLKAAATRAARGHALYDPCGSLRVSKVRWDTRVAPDHPYPGDLVMKLSLEVFHFAPERPRGDPACAGS